MLVIPRRKEIVAEALSKCGFSLGNPPATEEERRIFANCLAEQAGTVLEASELPAGGSDSAAIESLCCLERAASDFLNRSN
jgi:hypothetical protein